MDLNKVTARQLSKYVSLPADLSRKITVYRRTCGPIRNFEQLWQIEGMTQYHLYALKTVCVIREPIAHDERNIIGWQTMNRGQRSKSKNERGYNTVIFVDKSGKKISKNARSVHINESPSGNAMSLHCRGLKDEFKNVGFLSGSPTKSSANFSKTSPLKRGGTCSRNLSFPRAEETFWNKIYTHVDDLKTEEGRKERMRDGFIFPGDEETSLHFPELATPKVQGQGTACSPGKKSDTIRLSEEKKKSIAKWLEAVKATGCLEMQPEPEIEDAIQGTSGLSVNPDELQVKDREVVPPQNSQKSQLESKEKTRKLRSKRRESRELRRERKHGHKHHRKLGQPGEQNCHIL